MSTSTHDNHGWKTCSRGHKYRGTRCRICWRRGAAKRRPAIGEARSRGVGRGHSPVGSMRPAVRIETLTKENR